MQVSVPVFWTVIPRIGFDPEAYDGLPTVTVTPMEESTQSSRPSASVRGAGGAVLVGGSLGAVLVGALRLVGALLVAGGLLVGGAAGVDERVVDGWDAGGSVTVFVATVFVEVAALCPVGVLVRSGSGAAAAVSFGVVFGAVVFGEVVFGAVVFGAVVFGGLVFADEDAAFAELFGVSFGDPALLAADDSFDASTPVRPADEDAGATACPASPGSAALRPDARVVTNQTSPTRTTTAAAITAVRRIQ